MNTHSPSNHLASQLPSGGPLPTGRTPARTPYGRQTYRPDLGPTPIRPMVNPMSSLSDMEIPDIEMGGTGPEGQATTVIWGTDINAEALRVKVERFFTSFLSQQGEVKYVPLIKMVSQISDILVRVPPSRLTWGCGLFNPGDQDDPNPSPPLLGLGPGPSGEPRHI